MTKAITIKKQLEAEKKRAAILFNVIQEIMDIAIDHKGDLYELFGRVTVRKPYARAAEKLNIMDDFMAELAVRDQYAKELMDADPEQVLTLWQEQRPSDDSAKEEIVDLQCERQRQIADVYRRQHKANQQIAAIVRKNFEFQLTSGEEEDRRQAELYRRRCEANRKIAEVCRKNFEFKPN